MIIYFNLALIVTNFIIACFYLKSMHSALGWISAGFLQIGLIVDSL